ncbi:SusC/RagA family TonB-linked outer membrane protein [Arenibacter sp. 6A1]|uniref:SusC/RagA family TonB-linked outer membrane protein n=1 Tax=Arenibacter sp. 6A1 TaxID=2720391 RepID=UPI001444AE3C|nr:SusC/RagA family TonB-linked outer membrane protein [Arenibacter sp. 6A1]NKI26217.1 SusC/RagA family TonB-linked outer membrane protein [Arenibacter sp. 6A1]
MKIKYFLFLKLFLVSLVMMAQEKTITGNVTDQSGLPLPGVNILVVGTTNGTQSDFDGNYTIKASVGQSLSFSYVGQKTLTIAVGNSNTINAVMEEDAQALEEVIVVGYGTSTKQSFTGSVKQIDSELLDRKSVSNVSQALTGESAGVRVINTSGQPGSEATIRIRGFGSVNGNRDPLYVVDGVPYSGNISALNPSDIASTTILKDASATAIFGARGANGVVVINTKKGKNGNDYIEVETKTGQNFSLLPRYSTIKSPEQYIGLSWEALKNRGASFGRDEANAAIYANDRLFTSAGVGANYNMWNVANGGELIDPATGMVRDGVTRKYNPENWEDYAFQASNRTEANLKISGGNAKTNYFSSIGYLNDKGYSINSDYERYSARLNVNHQVKDWLHGSMNLGYTVSETNNGGQSEDSGSVFWFVDNIPSIYPLFLRDAEGNTIPDPYYGGNVYDYGQGRGFGGLTNAISDAQNSVQNRMNHEINFNTSLDIKFTDYLTLENRFGTQYYNSSYDEQNGPFYGPSSTSGGSIYKTKTEVFSYNMLNLLRFKKQFDDHSVEALVAHENNSWERKYLNAYKTKLVDPFGTELNNAVVSSPAGSYTRDYTLESYFGQLNYNYDNKYFVSGTVRRDGSSRFLKNKWGTFGSIGAAWAVINEDFMLNQDLFSNLKLKASYGLIGEQGGVGYYPGYDLFEVENLNDEISLSFDSKGNPDLTWETSKMFQTGVEFGIGSFLDVAVDYYIKNTDDLIFDRRNGPSLGYALIKVNDGALRNKGLEFDVTAHLVKSDDFYVDLSVNGEFLDNEMTKMPIEPTTGEQKIIDIDGRFGRSVGHSLYDFYTREYAGVNTDTGVSTWNVYYFDENNDGKLQATERVSSMADYVAQYPERANALSMATTETYSEATQKYVGKSAIPTVRGAFNLSTGYKGFDLSAQFLYSVGGYAYDAAYAGLMSNDQAGGNNWHTDILNRWQQPGDVTDVPRISSDYDKNVVSSSTRFITKSDFLNLNNIRLGYTIPKMYVEKIGMSNLNFWVSGDNLWLLSERKGFNPSTDEAGTSDRYRYSPLSTVTFGVRAKF